MELEKEVFKCFIIDILDMDIIIEDDMVWVIMIVNVFGEVRKIGLIFDKKGY